MIEKASTVDAMLFDKTGTLTRGAPEVLEVTSYLPRALPARRLPASAAAVETRHRHPVAQAVLGRPALRLLRYTSAGCRAGQPL